MAMQMYPSRQPPPMFQPQQQPQQQQPFTVAKYGGQYRNFIGPDTPLSSPPPPPPPQPSPTMSSVYYGSEYPIQQQHSQQLQQLQQTPLTQYDGYESVRSAYGPPPSQANYGDQEDSMSTPTYAWLVLPSKKTFFGYYNSPTDYKAVTEEQMRKLQQSYPGVFQSAPTISVSPMQQQSAMPHAQGGAYPPPNQQQALPLDPSSSSTLPRRPPPSSQSQQRQTPRLVFLPDRRAKQRNGSRNKRSTSPSSNTDRKRNSSSKSSSSSSSKITKKDETPLRRLLPPPSTPPVTTTTDGNSESSGSSTTAAITQQHEYSEHTQEDGLEDSMGVEVEAEAADMANLPLRAMLFDYFAGESNPLHITFCNPDSQALVTFLAEELASLSSCCAVKLGTPHRAVPGAHVLVHPCATNGRVLTTPDGLEQLRIWELDQLMTRALILEHGYMLPIGSMLLRPVAAAASAATTNPPTTLTNSSLIGYGWWNTGVQSQASTHTPYRVYLATRAAILAILTFRRRWLAKKHRDEEEEAGGKVAAGGGSGMWNISLPIPIPASKALVSPLYATAVRLAIEHTLVRPGLTAENMEEQKREMSELYASREVLGST